MTTLAKRVSSDTQTGAISVESLPPLDHGGVKVLTTELLANLYGTSSHSITKNHRSNLSRFVCGKHYFKLEGIDLKEFKNKVTNSDLVASRAKHLILWTERGAARHAKMLETDRAWDVFEKLEDFYFSHREKTGQIRKNRQCTARQRIPLRQTAGRLIATGVGKIYPDIWKLIHHHFDVDHIHQLQPEQVGEAIEYLNLLEDEFLEKQKALSVTSSGRFTDKELCALCWVWNAAEYMREKIELVYPAMKTLNSEYAGSFYSMAFEYKSTLEAGRAILDRETKHMIPHLHDIADENWRRVLPRLRQKNIS